MDLIDRLYVNNTGKGLDDKIKKMTLLAKTDNSPGYDSEKQLQVLKYEKLVLQEAIKDSKINYPGIGKTDIQEEFEFNCLHPHIFLRRYHNKEQDRYSFPEGYGFLELFLSINEIPKRKEKPPEDLFEYFPFYSILNN